MTKSLCVRYDCRGKRSLVFTPVAPYRTWGAESNALGESRWRRGWAVE